MELNEPIIVPKIYNDIPQSDRMGYIINVTLSNTIITVPASTIFNLNDGYLIPAGVWISNLIINMFSSSNSNNRIYCGISTNKTAFEQYSSGYTNTLSSITTIGERENGVQNTRFLALSSATIFYPLFKYYSQSGFTFTVDPTRSWWTLIRIA